ncbi:MAG TPA: hypothetical protein PLB41_18185, partial [Rubrivivax sp.]|nr:hypothetical protein [Rubrivivax sp.]
MIANALARRGASTAKRRIAARTAGRRLFGLAALVATGASAQMFEDAAAFRDPGSAPGQAVGGGVGSGGRGLYVTPTLSANLTATNNVNLSSTNQQSALILGITPGITLGWQLGRNQGYLNYGL